jgi:hypothetical protein
MSQETARQLQRKYELYGTGSFVAVSDAFPDAPAAVQNAVKLEFRTGFSEENRVQTLFSTDVVLIDLRAVDPDAIDPGVVRRDCERFARIVETYPDASGQLIRALLQGSPEDVDRAQQIAERVGLTEGAFLKDGGGLLFLVVVAGAALLAGGCATVNSNKPLKQSTTPKPTPTPDAGPPDDAGGRIPR